MHERLAELVLAGRAERVADLGAGQGDTLVEVAHRSPHSRLTAVDVSDDALAALSARVPEARIVRHDLTEPLPFPDQAFGVVVSHNTLECLLEPGPLLEEIARVLQPAGMAVLGHTDFDTIVVAGEDRDLTRRVLRTYADLPILYRHMANADAQMGRQLPGLIRGSPLRLEAIHAHTTVLASLSEAWAARLEEVATAVRHSAKAGLGHVTLTELDAWIDALHESEASGRFLFSETAYIATATAPAA